MQNTKQAQEKQQDEYYERGYWALPKYTRTEPYLTWEDVASAVLRTMLHEAIENSLQLSAEDRICNDRKEIQ